MPEIKVSQLASTTSTLTSDVLLLTNSSFSKQITTSSFASSIFSRVNTDLLPSQNLVQSLGSLTRQWKDLYLGTSTLYVGGIAIGVSPSGRITVDGDSAPATASLEPAGKYWNWTYTGMDANDWRMVTRAGDYFYTLYQNYGAGGPNAPYVYKYSTDGITWQGSNDTSNTNVAFVPGTRASWGLNPILYNGKFIASDGAGNYVLPISVSATSSTVFRSCYTSTDGTSWTERVNAFPQGSYQAPSGYYLQTWNAVIWDGSRFICLSNGESLINNPRLVTSTNGQSWTQISPAAGGDVISAVTSLLTGYLWGSYNVYTTSLGVIPARICPMDIEYGNGIYIASCKLTYSGIGNASFPVNKVYTSPDAVNWTAVTLSESAIWEKITYGDGTWLLSGGFNDGFTDQRRLLRSTDNGATWARPTLPAFSTISETIGVNGQVAGVAFGDGRWIVAVDATPLGKVLISTDNGATFTRTRIDLRPTGGVTYTAPFQSQNFSDVTFGNGAFVGINGGSVQYSKPKVTATIEAPTITVGSGASSITLTTTSGDLVIGGVPLLSSISVSISSALTSYATISSIGSLTTSITSSILFSVSSTYVSVSSLSSSVSFYVSSALTSVITTNTLSSYLTSYITTNTLSSYLTSVITTNTLSSYLTSVITTNTLSSYLTSYATLDYVSAALTSAGTVAELNLSSAGLVFYTGDNTTSFTLNQSFSSVSINTDATSILIIYPSENLVSSIINLTTGSTIFANVSSSSTNVEIPFILSNTPTVSSSYGTVIDQQFVFYQSFGNGSSYAVTSSVNSSYTHTLHLSTNSGGDIWLAENNGWTLSLSSITVTTSVLFVTLIELYETSGSTTSVLVVPVTSSTNIQNSWSGNPVYFDNIDVGYTTSTSSYNGSDPGKLVYTNPNGVQYYEDGTIVYPNGNVESPSNFFINTSSGSTTFEFTTSGTIILPTGGDIKNSSGNSIICNIPCPTSSVPVTVTSTGTAGQLAFNSSHVYICVATNTWRRASITTW